MGLSDKQSRALKAWEEWAYGLAALVALSGAVLLGYQAFMWLKTGEWPPYAGREIFLYLEMDPQTLRWVGLRKIVVWLTDLPLALWLMLLPYTVALLVLFLVEDSMNEANAKKEAN